jgi:hypothetical protein
MISTMILTPDPVSTASVFAAGQDLDFSLAAVPRARSVF